MPDEDDKKVIIKFVIHHFLMMFMAVIIVFAVAYAYYSVQGKGAETTKMPVQTQAQSKGKAHPLPDFIIDKITPNDLGELKP